MNDTTKVSEVLTPDSMNETRFNSNNDINSTDQAKQIII